MSVHCLLGRSPSPFYHEPAALTLYTPNTTIKICADGHQLRYFFMDKWNQNTFKPNSAWPVRLFIRFALLPSYPSFSAFNKHIWIMTRLCTTYIAVHAFNLWGAASQNTVVLIGGKRDKLLDRGWTETRVQGSSAQTGSQISQTQTLTVIMFLRL